MLLDFKRLDQSSSKENSNSRNMQNEKFISDQIEQLRNTELRRGYQSKDESDGQIARNISSKSNLTNNGKSEPMCSDMETQRQTVISNLQQFHQDQLHELNLINQHHTNTEDSANPSKMMKKGSFDQIVQKDAEKTSSQAGTCQRVPKMRSSSNDNELDGSCAETCNRNAASHTFLEKKDREIQEQLKNAKSPSFLTSKDNTGQIQLKGAVVSQPFAPPARALNGSLGSRRNNSIDAPLNDSLGIYANLYHSKSFCSNKLHGSQVLICKNQLSSQR